jgi:hypothetical protein
MRLTIFTIKFLTETSRASFPSVYGGGHTINVAGVVSERELGLHLVPK